MTRKDNDKLNQLLRDWHERRLTGEKRAKPEDHKELYERILHAALDEKNTPDSPAPLYLHAHGRTPRRMKVALGVAAVVVAVLIAMHVRKDKLDPHAPPLPNDGLQIVEEPLEDDVADPILTELDLAELEDRLTVLEELDIMFNGNWSWMIERGNYVEVRTGTETEIPSSEGRPLAVRLTVMAREDGEDRFQVCDKTLFLTREGREIDVVLDDQPAREIYLWAYPVDEGLFGYECELDLKEPDALSVSTGGILQAGIPNEILSCAHDGREWRVYLTLLLGDQEEGRTL